MNISITDILPELEREEMNKLDHGSEFLTFLPDGQEYTEDSSYLNLEKMLVEL